jgi:hypothetical protein
MILSKNCSCLVIDGNRVAKENVQKKQEKDG